MEIAIFAAGCFWGVEATFLRLKGVHNTTVGYTGGHTENPNYKEVCTGMTGHTEAVQIEYDPEVISYSQLLEVFFSMHDPTTKNRQGPDFGTQYRSAIFFNSAEQKQKAVEYKQRFEREGRFRSSIVTEITAASEFYPAEEYHQRYFKKMGITDGICHF